MTPNKQPALPDISNGQATKEGTKKPKHPRTMKNFFAPLSSPYAASATSSRGSAAAVPTPTKRIPARIISKTDATEVVDLTASDDEHNVEEAPHQKKKAGIMAPAKKQSRSSSFTATSNTAFSATRNDDSSIAEPAKKKVRSIYSTSKDNSSRGMSPQKKKPSQQSNPSEFDNQMAQAMRDSQAQHQQQQQQPPSDYEKELALAIQNSKNETCHLYWTDQVEARFRDRIQVKQGYTADEFQQMFDSVVLDVSRCDSLADVEGVQNGWVRGANSTVSRSDSKTQARAQYGRILFDATERLFRNVLELNRDDVFLDVGHGVGNTVLQAAFVHQCEARGIEVIADRNALAVSFEDSLEKLRKRHLAEKDVDYQIGSIDLVYGSMEDRAHRTFLTRTNDSDSSQETTTTTNTNSRVIKAFCNNYNAVFSDRSAKARTKIHLDDVLAGLFAQMPVGSVLATFHRLNMMGDRDETEKRRQERGLSVASHLGNESFYRLEEMSLGMERDSVSWSSRHDKELIVFKYTRLAQASSNEAVFLCSNADCERAQQGEAIPATKVAHMDYSKEEVLVMNSCDCNAVGTMSRRRRDPNVNYAETG